MERIEDVLSERGWSMKIESELAKEFGLSGRQVRVLRKKTVERIREDAARPKEDRVVEFLKRVRSGQDLARTAKRYSPLSSMLAIEAKVLGAYEAQEFRADINVNIVKAPEWDEHSDDP